MANIGVLRATNKVDLARLWSSGNSDAIPYPLIDRKLAFRAEQYPQQFGEQQVKRCGVPATLRNLV